MSKVVAPEVIENIKEEGARWQALKQEIKKRVIGQEQVIDRILIGILCNGHILLEGVPGLAKTTLVTAVADAIGLDCKRIQFTPDLLPADVIGTQIYSPKTEDFTTKKGPVFANLVLADEINRAPAKVQSALLEAMQERQVTIGDETFKLPSPFFVLATQNPIDQEGTYQLPEAQMDRFLLKVIVHYPTIEEEKKIIKSVFEPEKVNRVLTAKEVKATQALIQEIYVDDKVVDYLLSIIFATRQPELYKLDSLTPLIMHGASPRATLALFQAAKAHAFLKKRHFVIPDDIKAIAPDVLRHRILLTYQAEAESMHGDAIIQAILKTLPSP
ncbi:MAG: MoxR-like ATPase [Candidatus Dependentiae bacterium]|nr:MoxR-like ATPase [Candidatus Dependentiae bacterium]